jgi:type II secretory pathway pseudopilin PulG
MNMNVIRNPFTVYRGKPHFRWAAARGYSLAEVMVATVMIGMAMGASLSLTSTIIVQEELSWRTTVALNYQENMARLWQLGLGTGGSGDTLSPRVTDIMPVASTNRVLSEALNSLPTATLGTTAAQGGLGTLETATAQVTVRNYASGSTPPASQATLFRQALR